MERNCEWHDEAERLRVQLQDRYGAEQIGADRHAIRDPGGEDDERQAGSSRGPAVMSPPHSGV